MNKTLNLTDEARDILESWFLKYTPHWMDEGADVEEVREDLECHLVSEYKDQEIGEVEIKEALERMGLPMIISKETKLRALPWKNESAEHVHLEKNKASSEIVRFFRWITVHWFWVLLWPAGVVSFEGLTDFCADSFFAPFASWWHVSLVLLACLGAWFHYREINKEKEIATIWHGVARYASMIIAGYWSVLLLPIVCMGMVAYGMGVCFSFGIGLLFFPIAFICVLIAGAPLLLWAGLLRNNDKKFKPAAKWGGFALGLVLLLVVEGPSYVTRYGVVSDNPGMIRVCGSKSVLLSMCYEGRGGRASQMDSSGFLLSVLQGEFGLMGGVKASNYTKESRLMYYRVTGRAFNSVEAPSGYTKSNHSRNGRGFDFDENLGGDGVFARIQDLDLTTSRLDGHVDHASGLAYWEWTQEFSNTGSNDKEARMQILLPSNGVVSRLTLWVNGEPQEAAFASKKKVTKAYKSVAVVRRRDPVLVRWVAPDRVLVQCFPVPSQGKMKIRLGVTAPLDKRGRLFLPRLIEQNFGIAKGLETDFWVQGDTELMMEGVKAKGVSGKWRETHGKLSARDLVNKNAHVRCSVLEKNQKVWAEDPFAEDDQKIVIRELLPKSEQKAKSQKIVVVVDGSADVEKWRESIWESLENLRKSGNEVHLVLAAEDRTFVEPSDISKIRFKGGQDNLAALEKGFDLASENQADVLLWMHGVQPVEFNSAESLLQRLERGFHQPKLMTLDLSGGVNRILETLSSSLRIDRKGRVDTFEDLPLEMNRLLGGCEENFKWTVSPKGTEPLDGVKVWDQLVRWKVWREIEDAKRSDAVIKRASTYQLVTPVSGAVVLETKAQYKQFGLKQIDASAAPHIPSVPEPSSSLLIMLGLLTLSLKRQRAA